MNKIVLFSLVSRQAMANVIPALQVQPARVILFTTTEEQETAKRINVLLNQRKVPSRIFPHVVSAYNGADVYNALAQELTALQKDESPVLNVTGGTKIMAFAAHQLFVERNLKIIYCNTAEDTLLTLLPEQARETISVSISLPEYLRVHGYAIANTPQRTLQSDNEQFLRNAVLPRLQDFENFFDIVRSRDPNQHIHCSVRKFQFEYRKKASSIELHDEQTKLRTVFTTAYKYGQWLEDLAFLVIREQHPDDILCNIEITSPHGAKNELDVAAVHNGKIIFLSCKTGKLNNESFHQLLSLKNLAGGTFGKGYVVLPKKSEAVFSSLATDVGLTLLTPEKLATTKFF